MRAYRWIVCGLLSVAFGASASAADTGKKKSADSRLASCAMEVKSLKQTSLVDLFLKSKGRYKLERKAGCLGDESGRELPAVLLTLPAYDEPYAIHVAATVEKTFVVPRIMLLDEAFTLTREVGGEQLKRRGGEMSADIFINPENAGERYVLVHADPDALGTTDSRITLDTATSAFPVSPTGAVGMWTSGKDQTRELKAVEFGKLTVTLVGEKWEALRKK